MENVIINPQDIQMDTVILIHKDGQNKGEIHIKEALQIASSEKLDLVIVNRKANPIICKIIDYAKMKYRKKIAKKKDKRKIRIKTKEIRINIDIAKNDLKTKINYINRFLTHKNKVLIVIKMKRRNKENSINIMREYCNGILDMIDVEYEIDGKSFSSKSQYSIKIKPK